MRLYCPQCRRLFEGEKCPQCGKHTGREPEKEDWCLLYSGGQIWADMAADVLKQNEIPSMVQSSRGAAIAVLTGILSQPFDLYVPFADYAQADEIVQSLFAQTEEQEFPEDAENEDREEEEDE